VAGLDRTLLICVSEIQSASLRRLHLGTAYFLDRVRDAVVDNSSRNGAEMGLSACVFGAAEAVAVRCLKRGAEPDSLQSGSQELSAAEEAQRATARRAQIFLRPSYGDFPRPRLARVDRHSS
jgi:hypothetical protein